MGFTGRYWHTPTHGAATINLLSSKDSIMVSQLHCTREHTHTHTHCENIQEGDCAVRRAPQLRSSAKGNGNGMPFNHGTQCRHPDDVVAACCHCHCTLCMARDQCVSQCTPFLSPKLSESTSHAKTSGWSKTFRRALNWAGRDEKFRPSRKFHLFDQTSASARVAWARWASLLCSTSMQGHICLGAPA